MSTFYTPIKKLEVGGNVNKDNTPFKAKVDIESYLKGIGNEQYFSPAKYDLMADLWNYLLEKGVSRRNAAAMMGNIMQESSFNTNASSATSSATGLFQMLGDRTKHYKEWLKNNKPGKYPEVDYFLWVINNGQDIYMDGYNKQKALLERAKAEHEKYPNNVGLKKSYEDIAAYTDRMYGDREREGRLFPVVDFKAAWNNPDTTLDDLTVLFEETFERANKGAEHDKRKGYARAFY